MRPFFALIGCLAALSGCGTSTALCGPRPDGAHPICPAFDCVQQCQLNRASCLDVCTSGGCHECRGTRWVTVAYDCAPSCR